MLWDRDGTSQTSARSRGDDRASSRAGQGPGRRGRADAVTWDSLCTTVPSCSQHSPRRQKPHKPTATAGKERWGHERDGEAGCEQGEREAKGVPSVKRRRGGGRVSVQSQVLGEARGARKPRTAGGGNTSSGPRGWGASAGSRPAAGTGAGARCPGRRGRSPGWTSARWGRSASR